MRDAGQGTQAATRYNESLALYQAERNQAGVADCLDKLAGVARSQK